MNTVWEEFKNGGWMNWIILLFGLAGTAIALVSVVLAATRSRAALAVGVVAAALSAGIAGLGLIGTFMGRRMVDSALASGAISPTQIERIQRVGYAEARSCSKFGLGFALFPFIAGAIAVAAGIAQRRSSAAEPQPGPWTTPGAPGSPESPGGPSPIQSFYSSPSPASPPADHAKPNAPVLFAVVGVAALPLIGSLAVIKAPLPGRDLAFDDPTWAIDEAADEVRTGNLDQGCEDLEEALAAAEIRDPKERAEKPAGAPGDITSQCVEHRMKEALDTPDYKRRSELQALEKSKLPKTDEQARRIAESIARLDEPSEGSRATGDTAPEGSSSLGARSGKPPKVVMGATTVNGRLPPEVIQRIVRQNFARMRLCYEQGLLRDPNLEGKVNVKFVIGRDGGVSVAADSGSDLPDPAVVSCVVRVFKSLSFPQPEGGIVTVVYPIKFTRG